MMLFPVMYMEAEKIAFHSVLLSCKIPKILECSAPLWSFNFFSKLMRAANCVQFYLNLFCPEVNEGSLPHNKNDTDKTVLSLQFTSA